MQERGVTEGSPDCREFDCLDDVHGVIVVNPLQEVPAALFGATGSRTPIPPVTIALARALDQQYVWAHPNE
jgi:hypothetical protein